MKKLFLMMLCVPSLLTAYSVTVINNTGATITAKPVFAGCYKEYPNPVTITPDRGPNNPYVMNSNCCIQAVGLSVQNGPHQGKKVTAGPIDQAEARAGVICKNLTLEVQIKDGALKSFRK